MAFRDIHRSGDHRRSRSASARLPLTARRRRKAHASWPFGSLALRVVGCRNVPASVGHGYVALAGVGTREGLHKYLPIRPAPVSHHFTLRFPAIEEDLDILIHTRRLR